MAMTALELGLRGAVVALFLVVCAVLLLRYAACVPLCLAAAAGVHVQLRRDLRGKAHMQLLGCALIFVAALCGALLLVVAPSAPPRPMWATVRGEAGLAPLATAKRNRGQGGFDPPSPKPSRNAEGEILIHGLQDRPQTMTGFGVRLQDVCFIFCSLLSSLYNLPSQTHGHLTPHCDL